MIFITKPQESWVARWNRLSKMKLACFTERGGILLIEGKYDLVYRIEAHFTLKRIKFEIKKIFLHQKIH